MLSIKDVLYINDSKATNVDAAWYALECQKRPVVWIAGGIDKGNDYEVLKPWSGKSQGDRLPGGEQPENPRSLRRNRGKKMKDTRCADEAVKASSKFADPGDVVLLSPCCASFDLFTSYEDRGERFKEAVRRL